MRIKNNKLDRLWKDNYINGWDSPIVNSRGFAVTENKALFATHHRKIFLVSLDTMNIEEVQPIDSNGNCIEFFTYFGRGLKLFLKNEEELFYIDLNEV
jgi:hypothetical protein